MNKVTYRQNEEKIRRGEQFAAAETLFDPVAFAAERFPNNTALRFMGVNIRYKTLQKQVNLYANALTATGLCAGEAVTFALPNIPESMYVLYAAAKAKLRIAPLHPLSTPDAVRVAMEKSGSRLVFTLHDAAKAVADACPFAAVVAVSPANSLGLRRLLFSLRSPLPKAGGNVYRLRDWLRHPDRVGYSKDADLRPLRDETSVLLQSGGTTGTPKVIGLSAKSINNLAQKGLRILGRDTVTDCGMLSVLPVFHGFGLAMGVHAMLCHGGKNVLFPKFHRAAAVREIGKGNVQFMIGVPRLYEALLSHPKFSGKRLRSLVTAFVGGDFVPHTLLNAFDSHIAQANGTCRLFEGYGLTETVTVCSVNTAAANRNETVGKPIPGIEIAAFDFSVTPPKPLPPNEKGELAVAGDTLMCEYAGDAAATNGVFFVHNDTQYVRTGDCGYMDADGFVHFVSRIKRIIKVRGIPVYPMEIEQLVCAQPGVRGACVVPVQKKATSQNVAEEQMVLFVEGDDPAVCDTLRTLIREKISVYAEPTQILLVPQFPLTNVSKINTAELLRNYLPEE